jgi:hypothetical protein
MNTEHLYISEYGEGEVFYILMFQLTETDIMMIKNYMEELKYSKYSKY